MNFSCKDLFDIDDSENISIRLQEFFAKLGYKETHLAKHVDDGIKKFQELGKDGIHPVVFLDYEIEEGISSNKFYMIFYS